MKFNVYLGTLGVFFQLLLVIGILLTFVSGFSQNLKLITTFCAMAPAIFPFIMCAIPESPMFYLKRNNEDKAREALQYFRGNDDINDEYSAMKVSVFLNFFSRQNIKIVINENFLGASANGTGAKIEAQRIVHQATVEGPGKRLFPHDCATIVRN